MIYNRLPLDNYGMLIFLRVASHLAFCVKSYIYHFPENPMTSSFSPSPRSPVVYESSDGTPVADSYDNIYAIVTILEVLKQYLKGMQATVLANQFLYYSPGFPKARTAPDIMVIFDVPPGGRDNYKIWEEGQVPSVIFEVTSKQTEDLDKSFKKTLYEQLGVLEYWLFDPKGEWIKDKLQGYRLRGETYETITDFSSEPLQLRLEVAGNLINFYRIDTSEKLLTPDELWEVIEQKNQDNQHDILLKSMAEERAEQHYQMAQQERERASQLEYLLERYISHFGELPQDESL
jgi:hypothetical protein